MGDCGEAGLITLGLVSRVVLRNHGYASPRRFKRLSADAYFRRLLDGQQRRYHSNHGRSLAQRRDLILKLPASSFGVLFRRLFVGKWRGMKMLWPVIGHGFSGLAWFH